MRHATGWRIGVAAVALVTGVSAPRAQRGDAQQAALKTTYVRLANNANAVLVESSEPSPKRRIVAINTHPDHNNNFEYFIGRELAARGYRALLVNYYGPKYTPQSAQAACKKNRGKWFD